VWGGHSCPPPLTLIVNLCASGLEPIKPFLLTFLIALLAYTWIANWHDDKTRRTVVRWELTATKNNTHVKVTHSGLAQEAAARKDYSGGWPGVVEALKKFVEK
jgi:Activator of Hsp90 ATPase homolog 1-like protein